MHPRTRAISSKETMLYVIVTVKLVLSDRMWALKKWPLNTGGLCIEVKINSKGAFGTQPVVFKERWSLDTGGL